MTLLRIFVVLVAIYLARSGGTLDYSGCQWNHPCKMCLDEGCYFVVPHVDMPLCVRDWRPYRGRFVTVLTPGSQVACSRQPTPVPAPTAFPVPMTSEPPFESTTESPNPSTTTAPPFEPGPAAAPSSWPSMTLIVISVVCVLVSLVVGGMAIRKWCNGRGHRYNRIYHYQTGIFERANLFRNRGRIDPSELAFTESEESARRRTSGSPVSTFNNPVFRPATFTAVSPTSPSSTSQVYSPPSMLTIVTTVPHYDLDLSSSSSTSVQPNPGLLAPPIPTAGSSNSSEILLDLSIPSMSVAAAAALNVDLENAEGGEEMEELFHDSMEEQHSSNSTTEETGFRVWSTQHPTQLQESEILPPPPPPRQSRRLKEMEEKRRSSQQE